jgi:F0F1-type ATP synthase membrane subunit b/b'
MNILSVEGISTLLNFSVVVFILWYAGRKPIKEMFAARSSEIGTAVDEAKKVSVTASRLLEEWKSKSANAQADLSRQKDDAKQSLAKFKEQTAVRVASESKRIVAESSVMATAEAAKMKRSLRRQIAQESLLQARNYLEKHVESKDSKKLLGDYLERVADGHAG